MALAKRERYIVTAAIMVVAVLAADRYVLSPVLDLQSQLEARKKGLVREMDRAMALFKRKKTAESKWKEMVAGGLKPDAAETENALLHAIREWSQDANLTLSSVRPERTARKGQAPEVAVQIAATGPMNAVAKFLWRLQTTPLPVKAVETQLSARREGTDDLSLQIRLSALYLPPEWKAPAPARATPVSGRNRS